MKKLFLLFLMALVYVPVTSVAQQVQDSTIVFVTIPKNMKIQDKIILQNKSPYFIIQCTVALKNDDGSFTSLGSASYINNGAEKTIASYDDNELKFLRGKTIAIKAKGAKIFTGQNTTSVGTPYGFVGVKHDDISADMINNLNKSDYTYLFDYSVFENNHDLYIQISFKGENGVMDF